MKRNLIRVMAAVSIASVFSVAGCGGGGGGTPVNSAPVALPSVDATGTWTGTYTSSVFGSKTATLSLVQNSAALTGNYSNSIGGLGSVSGIVSGNTATFTINVTVPGCSGSFAGTGTINTTVTPATMAFTYNGAANPVSCGGSESGTGNLTKTTTPAASRFINKGNGTIYDSVANLTWLKTATCFSLQNWDNAFIKSSTLASGQCGLTDGSRAGDWHLPTIDELRLFGDAGYDSRTLNTAGFSSVQGNSDDFYWSSSTLAANSNSAWNVFMINGSVHFTDKSGNGYVWPVRSGQ